MSGGCTYIIQYFAKNYVWNIETADQKVLTIGADSSRWLKITPLSYKLSSHQKDFIQILNWGAPGVTIIVVGNGISDQVSSSEPGCLRFNLH